MKSASVATTVAALMLTGCSGLLQNKEEPDQTYMLRAAPAPTAPAPSVPGVLSVLRPVMQPGLDTDRILLTRNGQELDHFASSRWSDSLSRVVAALAVQSLAGSGGFANVAEAGRGPVASDYELLLTVRHFEAAYDSAGAAPVIHVALECTLVASTPRRVLGRCDATAEETANDNRMGAIVAAMERATQRALAQVRSQAVGAANLAAK